MVEKEFTINDANNIYVGTEMRKHLGKHVKGRTALNSLFLYAKELDLEEMFSSLALLFNEVDRELKQKKWETKKMRMLTGWENDVFKINVLMNKRIFAWLNEVVSNGTMSSVDSVVNAILYVFKSQNKEGDDEWEIYNDDERKSFSFIQLITELQNNGMGKEVNNYWRNILDDVSKTVFNVTSDTVTLVTLTINKNLLDFEELPMRARMYPDDFINTWILYAWFLADSHPFNAKFLKEMGFTLPLTIPAILENFDTFWNKKTNLFGQLVGDSNGEKESKREADETENV